MHVRCFLDSERDMCCILADTPRAASKIEPGEDALQHVKRYLRTIPAWFVACRALSAPRKAQGVPLHFYHLKAAESGDAIPPEVAQQFKATYLEFVKSTQAGDGHYRSACTFLDSAFPPGSSRCRPMSVVVHAEAAIMALASNSLAYNDGSVELLCLRLCRTGSGSVSGRASTIRRHGLSYLPYTYILLFCTYLASCHPSI